jgi:hypothetical protein
MNYKRHYDLLITRGKSRMLDGYVEKHHIIPRCMGGTDDIDNLVQLTPEEHYLAHQLLIKMYPDIRGLARATQLMTIHHTKSRTNNKLFGWVRRKCAADSSAQMIEWHKENEHPKGMLGKNHDEKNISRIVTGLLKLAEEKKVKVYSYNLDGTFYKEYDSITSCAEDLNTSPSNVKYTADGNFGHCRKKQIRYVHTESIEPYKRKKQVIYERTEEHNKKTSERFMKMTTCEHCGLTARLSNISRWHNNNCKYKKK